MKSIVLCVTTLLLLVGWIECHTWIACTDYKIENEAAENYYDESLCKAHARSYKDCCEGQAFGIDRGFDYRPHLQNRTCRDRLTLPYSDAYSSTSPMAKYSPGQKVCLAWPSKNHVAATCNNPWIPDHGTKLYVSVPNPQADADVESMRLVKDFGTNTRADGFVGFQHCPKFCENNDKSLCSGCFDVPQDLQVGATYTFTWEWAFNADTDLYSSCWEAEIVAPPA
jgi:hypothetical protein